MRDLRIASALDKVRARFINELPRYSHELTMLRTQVEHGVLLREASTEICLIAHRMAGTAATLGFPEIGSAAARLEEAVSRRSHAETGPADLLTLMDGLQEMIRNALDPDKPGKTAAGFKVG